MINLVEQVELVDVYHNGTDALNTIHKLKPNMAILDNKMPNLKGVDVIREIRKENHTMNMMMLTLFMS